MGNETAVLWTHIGFLIRQVLGSYEEFTAFVAWLEDDYRRKHTYEQSPVQALAQFQQERAQASPDDPHATLRTAMQRALQTLSPRKQEFLWNSLAAALDKLEKIED